MAKLSRKHKEALAKFDKEKQYSVAEAVNLLKEISYTKFDASVDLNIRLGVDPRKANQMVRGSVTLPHGTGKEVRVLVLCTPDMEEEAKAAGADHVGLDDYVQKIKDGWTDVDVVITMPSVMAKVGQLGRILGPRGLMPNPKTGTVTMEIGKAVTAAKAGKIDFKVDKYGIIHSAIAKLNFESNMIADNAKELVNTIIKMKPASAKGTYVRSIYMSSTMSPGIQVDPKSFSATS
jgi:large subunit ribosomal protein L1